MGEGDAEVEAPAFMPGEDVHFYQKIPGFARLGGGCCSEIRRGLTLRCRRALAATPPSHVLIRVLFPPSADRPGHDCRRGGLDTEIERVILWTSR